jgi:hypothetical protein
MKLKLHWSEKFEVVTEYPQFTLDAEEFPELELEIQQVWAAPDKGTQEKALADLEYKMHHTEKRGETIMQIVGPWNDFDKAQVSSLTEEEGFLKMSAAEEE